MELKEEKGNYEEEKFFYRVYGLKVKSDFQLNELINLAEYDRNNIDVEIINGKISDNIKKIDGDYLNNTYTKENMYFKASNVAKYNVLNGNKIIVETFENYDKSMFKIYLLGIVFAFLMIEREKIAIHGGAVDINGKGILIVGKSGAGKSTLTTALRQKGYKLLADDMTALDNDKNGQAIINPSFPMQRITHDVLEDFGYDKSKFNKIFLTREKYFVPAKDEFQYENKPLYAIFHLSEDDIDEVTVEEVHGTEKLSLIFSSIFRGYVLNEVGISSTYFKKCLNIANKVPIYKVKRPKKGFTVNKQMELIEAKLKLYNYAS